MCVASGECSTSTGSMPRDSTPSKIRSPDPSKTGAMSSVSSSRNPVDKRLPHGPGAPRDFHAVIASGFARLRRRRRTRRRASPGPAPTAHARESVWWSTHRAGGHARTRETTLRRTCGGVASRSALGISQAHLDLLVEEGQRSQGPLIGGFSEPSPELPTQGPGRRSKARNDSRRAGSGVRVPVLATEAYT